MIINMKQSLIAAIGLLLSSSLFAKDYLISTSKTSLLITANAGELGKHILPLGWNNWGKKENEKTVFYAEYESRGEGAHPKARAAFSQQLKNLKGYERNVVLAGEDGWNPIENGNKLITVKR